MKKNISIVFLLFLILFPCFANGAYESQKAADQVTFTDSCGRTVAIPKVITKISPAGPVATMILECLAPEYMCSVSGHTAVKEIANLPVTGSLFGGKSSINCEELLICGTELIIDIGEYKKGIEESLDSLQSKTGIPCIFINGDLSSMADTFRILGSILYEKKERAEEIASFIDQSLEMAQQAKAKIKKEEVKTVLYTGNSDGLGTNPKGSSQARVLDIIGAENAVVLSSSDSKSFGNQIDTEMLYTIDPDVIIFAPGSIYKSVSEDRTWQVLKAIKNKTYYEVPSEPYNYLGNPSSVNSILGIWWLGNLLYPQYFDYNLEEVINTAREVLWKSVVSE